MLVIICVIWGIGFEFGLMFSCNTDVWAYFSSIEDLTAYCGNLLLHQYLLGITDVVIDIVIFMIPMPLVSLFEANILRLGNY